MTDIQQKIFSIRSDYAGKPLDEGEVDRDPMKQFECWMKEAVDSNLQDPNAMVLSTATPGGKPSARVVLLRGFSEKGFAFYTNYNSRKGMELLENPHACLSFFWPEIARQVKIEGLVTKLASEESEAYFRSRPKDHQLGAWASMQSKVIGGRDEIERQMSELEIKYKDQEVPRPHYWGGFSLLPELFEFWQGRMSRLHDRIQYSGYKNGEWLIERLSP